MPRATLDTSATVRHELKSLVGGYVVLKRMSYGDILQRRAMQMQMAMEIDSRQKSAKMDINTDNRKVALFEFSKCIVEHNLTDENDRPLNLLDPVVFGTLEPRVGQEVEALIGDLNNWEDQEADFPQKSELASWPTETPPQTYSSQSS